MSSEAITQNDLLEVLNSILPISTPEPVVLYEGSVSSGTFSLSDSIAKYQRISIVANDNDGVTKTFEIITNGSSSFQTYLDFTRITGAWYAKSILMTFSGTTVNIGGNGQAWFSTTGQGTYVTITRIYGHSNLIVPTPNASDYIVEQGTSGIWAYRKWNSGVMEAWGNAESLAITNGYYVVPCSLAFTDAVASITGWYGTDANRGTVDVYQTFGGMNSTGVIVYVRNYSGGVIYSGYGRASIYLFGHWK